ncbi:MAG: carboxypeptidase regulatory-like domain-containing protein [Planctomycetes bacterium]|nr:carboxypeptidase regulatory-like domain-containing protein [Planctomycetota bacterium]MBI3844239.1 carboxypeptidase regulatory-like domain-containing protein [Planctomycetota bacterium]
MRTSTKIGILLFVLGVGASIAAIALLARRPSGSPSRPSSVSDGPTSGEPSGPAANHSRPSSPDAASQEAGTPSAVASGLLGSIRGRLLDALTETPLAGLVVRSDSSDGPATSGPDGAFHIDSVRAGGVRIWIDHAFLRMDRGYVRVAASQVTDLGDVLVRSGGALRGRVIDPEGAPVEGATVRAGDRLPFGVPGFGVATDRGPGNASTGSDGTFLLQGLPTERARTIVATHPDFAPAALDRVIPVAGVETGVPDIRLSRGSSISGRVTDPNGKPIVAAVVRVRSDEAARFDVGPFERDARTDEDGRYRVPHLLAGKKSVAATAKGFARAAREAVVVSGVERDELAGIDLVLEPGHSISGRVLGPDGAPVAKARVTARPSDGRPPMGRGSAGESNDDGTFRLDGLSEGVFSVSAWAQGFLAATRDGAAADSIDLEIALVKGASISGKVVSADTGDGIAAARVTAGGRSGEGAMQSVSTDDVGNFRVDGLAAGTFVLTANADDFAPATSDPIVVNGAEEATDVSIALAPGATICGVVLDASDRSPIAGAVVRVVGKNPSQDFFDLPMNLGTDDENWGGDGFGSGGVRTSKDGSFTLRGIVGGSTTVEAKDRRHVSARAEDLFVDRGGVLRNVELLLPRGGSVRGVVTGENGQPEPGAHVSITGENRVAKETETDAEGAYLLEGIPAGHYQVFRYSGGLDSGVQESLPADVRDGDTTIVDFGHHGARCRLFGQVRDGDESMPFASVDFWLESDTEQFQGKSVAADAQGAYEVVGLLPGRYRAAVNQRFQGGRASFSITIDVPATATELRVDLVAPQGRLIGRVVDAVSGDPIAGAFVSVNGDEESGGDAAQGISGADGRYEIGHLAPGSYEVTVNPPAVTNASAAYAPERIASVVISEGRTSSVDFKLVGGGALEVSVRNAQGDRIDPAFGRLLDENGAEVELWGGGDAEPGSDLRLDSVHPGTYTLEVIAEGLAASRRFGVRIDAGRVRHEDVILTAGGALRVIVNDRDGREIEPLSVSIRTANGFEPLVDLQPFGLPRTSRSPGYLDHLAPGTYVVKATVDSVGDGAPLSATVTIDEGRETNTHLTVR